MNEILSSMRLNIDIIVRTIRMCSKSTQRFLWYAVLNLRSIICGNSFLAARKDSLNVAVLQLIFKVLIDFKLSSNENFNYINYRRVLG